MPGIDIRVVAGAGRQQQSAAAAAAARGGNSVALTVVAAADRYVGDGEDTDDKADAGNEGCADENHDANEEDDDRFPGRADEH